MRDVTLVILNSLRIKCRIRRPLIMSDINDHFYLYLHIIHGPVICVKR